MGTMMALRAHARGGPEQLVYEQAPALAAGPGEAFIAVHAAAITFAELTWDLSWTTRDGADRTPVIPSHEMSVTVAGLGDGIAGLAVGDEVIGLIDFDRDGAAAEYVAMPAASLAAKPPSVSHEQAATLPLAALTAWQAPPWTTRPCNPASRCWSRAAPAASACSPSSSRRSSAATSPPPAAAPTPAWCGTSARTLHQRRGRTSRAGRGRVRTSSSTRSAAPCQRPGLGAGRGTGLGADPGSRGGFRLGDGGVRADRAPVAVLDQLAAARGLALVCVQPLLVYRAREGEDLTRDKPDPKDAVLIARLASELRCYEPERASAVWARLRHLGARRSQLTTGATAAVNQIRDLLDCAWPAVLAASPSPFWSVTWCASLAVVPGPVRRGPEPGPPWRPGPVHRGGAAGAAPVGRDPAVPADHPGRVRRAGRSRRGHRAPPRRPGTRAPGAGRLAGYPRPPGRYRGPDVRGHGRARAGGPWSRRSRG